MTHYNIPVFVPHLGCPHDCVFCNQKKITGAKSDFIIGEAKKIIEEYLATIERENKERFTEIAFFGGSFTAIERDIFESLCFLASKYVKDGRVNGLRCSTRPDCIDDDTLEFMKKCGFIMIELGVQSTDDFVLLKSGRGHTRKDVFDGAKKIKEHGIGLGLQMMTGLPFDTNEKAIATANDIISLKPDCVRIYPTLVIEGTQLCKMYKSGEYAPQTLDNAVSLCAHLIEMFEKSGVNVVRVGLQTTDEINENTVIGPYHPAFRELCESRVYRNKIEKNLPLGNCIVAINDREISKAVGVKRENVNYFKEKYKIDIRFKPDKTVKKGHFIFM